MNGVVTAAGVTKGALFHHYSDKRAVVLALIDQHFLPMVRRRWVEPLTGQGDPLDLLGSVVAGELERIEDEGEAGLLGHGCPIANLAADVAGIDEVLRERLDEVYREWRGAVAGA